MNPCFERFSPELIADLAARTGIADSAEVEAILCQIAEHTSELISAGRSGYAPIARIEKVIVECLAAADQKNMPARCVLDVVARGIDHILEAHSYVPVRTEPWELGAERFPVQQAIYYRPTERQLFEEIDDGVPVLLTTSADYRRFGRAVAERYLTDSAVERRRVFVWTIASGLFELFERDGMLDFLPAGSPDLYHATVDISTLSEVCREQGVSRIEALRKFFVNSSEIHGTELNFEGQTFRVLQVAIENSTRNVRLNYVLDDMDDDDNPLDVSAAFLSLLQMKLEADAVMAASQMDQWPRTNSEGKKEDRMSLLGLIDFIMERQREDALYLIYDADVFMSDNGNGNKDTRVAAAFLRDASARLQRSGKGTQILLLAPPMEPPSALTSDIIHLDLALPSRRELLAAIRPNIVSIDDLQPSVDDDPLYVTDNLFNLIDAAAGMTLSDAIAAIGTALRRGANTGKDLIHAINAAKRLAVRRNVVLELIDREPPQNLSLGGMDAFWRWIGVRHRIFLHPEKASQFGIDKRPKGVLILGIPGTGKSLAAKLVAREWSLPLIRLDMGAIQDKWVGSSEQRIREALRIVEAMSPCVLWIDEIDKGMAQGEHSYSNSVDMNIRATLLTWLQENDKAVFVVATANRFANLPPELTRAGRFDARFFFGCPDLEGRQEILGIHLDLRKVPDIGQEDRLKLTNIMTGFTGAEIEQVVLDGLSQAFAADHPVSAEDFFAAAGRTKPLIRAVGRGLDEIWDLIEQGRVEPASDKFLTRAEVARLIEPELFSPMYCRREAIGGWEKHHDRAIRLLMRDQLAMPAAVVLDTGDMEWIYLETNFKMDPEDPAVFKLLDRLDEIETNGIVDSLIVKCGLETLWFESQKLLDRFNQHAGLKGCEELCRLLSQPQKTTEKSYE